jgi:hypothetical protein
MGQTNYLQRFFSDNELDESTYPTGFGINPSDNAIYA